MRDTINKIIFTLLMALLIGWALFGLSGATRAIKQELDPIETPVISTSTPVSASCEPSGNVKTEVYPNPSGTWVIETRFYEADDPRPSKWGGRAEGDFDIDGCAMAGSGQAGYNDLQIRVIRNGMGVIVQVDQIKRN